MENHANLPRSPMAARPHLAALSAEVARQGGDEAIFDRIAAGESVGAIMKDYGYSRTFFYRWIADGGEARAAKYKAAQRDSAEAHVEKGLEILDDLDGKPITPADVSLADKRAGYRRWLAGVRNEQFGDKPAQVNVGVSMGDLGSAFLQALKETGLPPAVTGEPVMTIQALESGESDGEPSSG